MCGVILLGGVGLGFRAARSIDFELNVPRPFLFPRAWENTQLLLKIDVLTELYGTWCLYRGF